MRLEDQIYFGCAAYSMIHPNRAAELDHLFLVNGNGYEWMGGQLVDVYAEQTDETGAPLPLNVMIERVFQQKRESAERRKAHDLEMQRDQELHPEKYPEMSDARLDELIENALKAVREEREKDPVAFCANCERRDAEFEAHKRQWEEEKKYEFCVPPDINQRVAYQDTVTGAHGGYNRWYPVCQYSMVVMFPDDVQDDYLQGIIEVCQLVLANPPQVDGKFSTDSTVAETLAEVKKALDRATKLAGSRI